VARSFRRFVSLTVGVAVAATGLVAQQVAKRADAQSVPAAVGKANPGGQSEKERPVPAVRDEVPTGFGERFVPQKGNGSPDWVGKSDPESLKKAADEAKGRRAADFPPVGANVEGRRVTGELIDQNGIDDGSPKVLKTKKQRRIEQADVDDPTPDDSEVRGPAVPGQPGEIPVVASTVPVAAVTPSVPVGSGQSAVTGRIVSKGSPDLLGGPPSFDAGSAGVQPRAGRKIIDLRRKPDPVASVAEGGDWIAKVGKGSVRFSDLDDPSGTVQLAEGSVEVGLRPLGGGKRLRPDKKNRRVGQKERNQDGVGERVP
jgi:hypothetical protein